MENSKDTPCNCETFLNNFLIKYEKDQIVLKILLFTLMEKIDQLEELQKNRESIGHWGPICPSAACKLAAAAARPASRPQVNFGSSQMETKKIIESNGTHGPPPIQPSHDGRLRAGLRTLCKYNYNRKDYANQNETKSKQNETKQNNPKRGGWAQRPLPHDEKQNSGQNNHGCLPTKL
jgi:hypothetical protein